MIQNDRASCRSADQLINQPDGSCVCHRPRLPDSEVKLLRVRRIMVYSVEKGMFNSEKRESKWKFEAIHSRHADGLPHDF